MKTINAPDYKTLKSRREHQLDQPLEWSTEFRQADAQVDVLVLWTLLV